MSSGITLIFRDAKGILRAATGHFTVSEKSIDTLGELQGLLNNSVLKEFAESARDKLGKSDTIDPEKPLLVPNLLEIRIPGLSDYPAIPQDFLARHVTMGEYEDKLRDAMKLKIGVVSLYRMQDENAKKVLKPTP